MHEGNGDAAEFYDQLAATYDRLYPDWELACREQGQALHALLCRELGPGPHRVLDAAVGIGTQLLGLTGLGHRVYGTDISHGAVRRAAAESARRGADAALGVADMRALPFAEAGFDAVVCADNAVPHLMSRADVTRALGEMRRVTRPGGTVLLSIRDYDLARREHPTGTPPQVSGTGGEVTITFQVWRWREDGARYDLQHFQLVGEGRGWRVACRTASYWAITRAELGDCAERAGLSELEWLQPEDSGFFQPVLMGRRAGDQVLTGG